MKLKELDQKIKLIIEAGFPFAKKDDKKDEKEGSDTEKKENPFAKKDDAAKESDKDDAEDSDSEDDSDEDTDNEEGESLPKASSAPSDVMPKSEVPQQKDVKKTDAQPVAAVKTELTGTEQQYLQPNPPLAPNAVKGEQPADAVAQLGGNQSALAKELGNFVETAKALKGVLDVLKDFAQPAAPVVVSAPAPTPAVPPVAPTQEPVVEPVPAQDVAKNGQPQSDTSEVDTTDETDTTDQAEDNSFGAEDQADVSADQETELGAEDQTDQEVQKGLTDEIKAAFKIKPGTKKYDPASHQVYWKVGDVLMVAPADNPEDESEVTDEETILSVGL